MAKRIKTLQNELCSLINKACYKHCKGVHYDNSWEAIFQLVKGLQFICDEVVCENGQYIHTKSGKEVGKSWVCTATLNNVTVKFNIQALFTCEGSREEYVISLYDASEKVFVNDPIRITMDAYQIPNLVWYND